ncbi:MAG: hypothetical protein J1E16_12175 [Muribaculaceae bacterium]|nr:hypothetical protein [Muribaculaceae bacterium]
MKFKSLPFIFSLLLIMSSAACKKIKKTDAEIERENWIAGFTDSIDYYQEHSRQLQSQLDIVNTKIGGMLEDFELIKNPREVSGYYLLKGWSKKIPFTTTAIYARINESEKFEMIATLAGSTFNKISVGPFESETVPHDQAFNFRHERFNSVYFTGGKIDTIGEYIANHHEDKLILEYLESGKLKKKFDIPKDEKDMISQTWNLYSAKREALTLEKELWISSHKIDTFRRIMEEENNRLNSKK